jgi:hypothetical protein
VQKCGRVSMAVWTRLFGSVVAGPVERIISDLNPPEALCCSRSTTCLFAACYSSLALAVERRERAGTRRAAARTGYSAATHQRPPLALADRLFLTAASRLLPRTDWRSFIITPETLL